MKLLFENWRKFLKEIDTVPARPPHRQTVREKPAGTHDLPTRRLPGKGLKAMDPADIKTPAPIGFASDEQKEIPEVQLSGEIQTHNAEMLSLFYESESSVRHVFTEGWGEFGIIPSALRPASAEKLINYIVANNPVFHNNKIVEYLGGGSFGFVVELDNDHALKIFVGSFDPAGVDFGNWIDKDAKSDVARYKGSQEKAFAGTGQAGELMIFDQGRIKTPWTREVEEPVINSETGEQEIDPETGEGITKIVLYDTWHYAEMQQLRTLSHWMRYVYKVDESDLKTVKEFNKELDAEIDSLKHFADEVVNNVENMTPEEQRRFGLDPEGQEKYINTRFKYLDKAYAKNLFDQIKEILKTKSLTDIRDIRAANVGISTQDESLPIIFDY